MQDIEVKTTGNSTFYPRLIVAALDGETELSTDIGLIGGL